MRHVALFVLLTAPAWGGYSNIRPITIDHTKAGASTHADFPVLIAGTYPWLATTANGGKVQNGNGYDVAFFADNTLSTQLKHEVEGYNAATGEVIYWVKVPWLSHTNDTVIYVAYGNGGISTSQADPVNVWDSKFKGIWHLGQDPSGTAPQLTDSTAAANNLTSVGSMTTSDLIGGKIGSAIDLDGVNDRLETADTTSLSITGEMTASIWFKMTNNPPSGREGLLCKWANYSGFTNQRSYCLGVDQSTGRFSGLISSTGLYGDGTVSNILTGSTDRANGAWHHAVMVFNPGASMVLYMDGQVEATKTSGLMAGIFDGTAKFWLGSQNTEETYYNAEAAVDEARVSNVARSADWILAEYNNQNSPSTFYTVGEEGAPVAARRRAVMAMLLGGTK
ncbi:MAG TPA: DUF2341 domain-containing protein [Bryobacteraceae bacterium]|nr:DUF2341 domain-containing protein [Bryobacteraceae bacterium]HPT25618.1 DUF2341 domain-containing protein [Bryobacteraceae bacterium]